LAVSAATPSGLKADGDASTYAAQVSADQLFPPGWEP
jgi:hypothetical protein